MDARTQHVVPVLELSPAAFAPYGEVIEPKLRGGQFDRGYEADDPQLTVTNGEPMLRIMRLQRRGLVFSKIARHRRVTQCLGALGGKDWFLAVAPPDTNAAAPRLEDIVGFHIPGDRIVKLHLATWHAGPHFVHDEALFLNLENRDTNSRDFEGAALPAECRLNV
ncbi:MAG TPA: ureidoglycolate lyase [Xanthobacteraceae bacterium]|nr:ureidoglycolate lyase [Xanthobacteraceae bacterium]